jgi:hypothetical protein
MGSSGVLLTVLAGSDILLGDYQGIRTEGIAILFDRIFGVRAPGPHRSATWPAVLLATERLTGSAREGRGIYS